MRPELFRFADGKKLRCGYTTGSCAAAAAKAAAAMLCGGGLVHHVRLMTPKGVELLLEIEEIRRGAGSVSCAVRKDAGDDPDVTNGILVYAEVTRSGGSGVVIEGGAGVGKVTRPGLDQPPGNAAINSTPRRMIEEAVREAADRKSGFRVEISIPDGEALAKKTFNPKLGIVGGISVLGTTGIVTPMSDEALLDSIRAEIRMRRCEGFPLLPIAPGNYGKSFMREAYGFDLEIAVESSNFIRDTIAMAADAGFTRALFAGHIGKLVKVAGGVGNTHSRFGDRRMEITNEILEGIAEPEKFRLMSPRIADCVSMDEAVRILKESGLDGPVLREMTGRVQRNLELWSEGRMQVEAVIFSNRFGELGMTARAREYMELLKRAL